MDPTGQLPPPQPATPLHVFAYLARRSCIFSPAMSKTLNLAILIFANYYLRSLAQPRVGMVGYVI